MLYKSLVCTVVLMRMKNIMYVEKSSGSGGGEKQKRYRGGGDEDGEEKAKLHIPSV